MDSDSSQTPSGNRQPSTENTSQLGQSQPTTVPAPGSTSNPVKLKRRRGHGVVTPIACTECRKKRAKCDGDKPCGRCKSYKCIDCIYEVPVRQSRNSLRIENEKLRLHQRSSDIVFAALRRPDLCEEVLRRLHGGQPIENISKWLKGARPASTIVPPLTSIVDGKFVANSGVPSVTAVAGASPSTTTAVTSACGGSSIGPLDGISVESLSPLTAPPPSMINELGRDSPWHFSSDCQARSVKSDSRADVLSWQTDLWGPPHSRVGSWAGSMHYDQATDGMPGYRGLEEVLVPLSKQGLRSAAGTWTKITGDVNLVQHLLALYFCWEYPVFASLSKEHFMLDFQAGRHRYYSPILVNALLALGYRFSTHPMTRANLNNPYSSGDDFFKESQRLLNLETDHHSLTTIQALGIMSIREMSCGRGSESEYYAGQSIRLAIEKGLHRVHDASDEDELAVQSATFWGAFALDHAWSLATGSLPQSSRFFSWPRKPAIIEEIEASPWNPYTDDGTPLQRSFEQPSNVRSVYTCFCELSELVHQSLYILQTPGKLPAARHLLSIYTQYLSWYDQTPEVLRLGHNFTPAVFFAHMYYHFAILLLFRPLIKLRIIGSKMSPRDICLQEADAIQDLLASYSQLYTLQRTPSFVPYFALTSATMHLTIWASSAETDSPNGEAGKADSAATRYSRTAEALKQGIADLTQMARCHHVAEQALNILCNLANKWSIDVGEDGKKLARDECDKLDRSYSRSFNFLSPSMETGLRIRRWDKKQVVSDVEPEETVGTPEKMANSLLGPFHLQGMSILLSDKELAQAGFALL